MQVRGFWAQLEAATNERQQAMFRVLNAHLKHLAQRVEAAVGDILEVTHTPVPAAATNLGYRYSVHVAVATYVPQTRQSMRRAYEWCTRNTNPALTSQRYLLWNAADTVLPMCPVVCLELWQQALDPGVVVTGAPGAGHTEAGAPHRPAVSYRSPDAL